ncbi:helix-turn-helix transcriptional regulator [Tahibacter sp.]|uniref:helix-turn-helix domain-containing protein n=1 Tax=Tahibacter sp. TaxID=2056211 RepID=UPI0028C3864D|nr:helix-turn-helix transcriptional regulator [Tahibacter sp.]
MTSFEKALGQVIAEERKRQCLTQEALADACGIHVTYISQLERGLKSPTVRVLRLIAKSLNTSASTLLTRAEHD